MHGLLGVLLLPGVPGSADVCPPKPSETAVAATNAGGIPGTRYTVQVLRGECYISGATGSWDAPGNEATGRQCFSEYLNKVMTFGRNYVGNWLAKKDCKGRTGGAAALIVYHREGHVALGSPRLDMTTNGETVFAAGLAITNALSRAAVHNRVIRLAPNRNRCDSADEVQATQQVIAAGWLQQGAALCLLTKTQLALPIAAFAQLLVLRGFVSRLGGGGEPLLLIAPESSTAGHVERVPRLLGSDPHSHETTVAADWMAFARYGAPETLPFAPDQQQQIESIRTVHRNNGALRPVALLRPARSRHPRTDGRPYREAAQADPEEGRADRRRHPRRRVCDNGRRQAERRDGSQGRARCTVQCAPPCRPAPTRPLTPPAHRRQAPS